MSRLEPIILPKETVSDDCYLILRLLVPSGSHVKKNQILLEFETSKAVHQLESPMAGYFFSSIQEGEEIEVGGLVGVISEEATIPEHTLDKIIPRRSTPEATTQVLGGETRISRPAEELIQQYGLDPKLFQGLAFVRREDVERVMREQKTTPKQIRPTSFALETSLEEDNRIILVGGGGHAKMCIDILRQMKTYAIHGILDANMRIGDVVLEVPVIGRDTELVKYHEEGIRLAVNAVGAASNHSSRSTLYKRIREAGFTLPNLIHPAAAVEPSAMLGEGNQIMAHATVGSGVCIADNCIINCGAVVSHDCHLGNNVHIAPGALLAGMVEVGEETLIGMGVTVYLGVKIGRRVTIPNGMNIFRDVPDGTVLRYG
jgi:sugar O-acyltransferase (sialic acid O-acetyltransferase NeuD family)